jgi:hypothetical protein
VLGVAPEVVPVRAAARDVRDAVGGVQHLADLRPQRLESGTAQRRDRLGVPPPHPGQRPLAGDVLQPLVRIDHAHKHASGCVRVGG